MAKFSYVGDEERYYSELGIVVSPGDVIDMESAPDDGRFVPVSASSLPSPALALTPTTPVSEEAQS
jgi:hypothetical protein